MVTTGSTKTCTPWSRQLATGDGATRARGSIGVPATNRKACFLSNSAVMYIFLALCYFAFQIYIAAANLRQFVFVFFCELSVTGE